MKENISYGVHAVEAKLAAGVGVEKLFYLRDIKSKRLDAIIKLAHQQNVIVAEVSRVKLDNMTGGENHQGVAVITAQAKKLHETDIKGLLEDRENAIVLILDGVQDPHNLGACLRSADAFGVTCVLIPKDKACSMTPIVAKVACGAAETVPLIQVTNLSRAIRDLQEDGFWVTGLAGEANQTIHDMDFDGKVGIVMGGEGEGLRRMTKENCDFLCKIPMVGNVESLNVSVATGVTLYEVSRRRTK